MSILLSLLLLQAPVARAQVLSQQGRFSVDYNQGCSPYAITINDIATAPDKNISYFLFVNGNLEELSSRNFNFTYPGRVTIVQWFEDRSPLADSLTIWGHEPIVPQFNTYACSNLGAVVEIINPTYDYYQVYFDANPTPVRADASSNWRAEGQFSTAGNKNIRVKGYYNNAPDNCAEANQTVEARPALPVAQWSGLQWDQESSQISIQFGLHAQVQYQLERLNSTTGQYEVVFPLKSQQTDTTFTQPGLANQYFCYRIKAIDDCYNNDVVSEPLCTAKWKVESHNGYNEITYETHGSFSGTIALLAANGQLVNSSYTASGTFRNEEVICNQEYCYQLSLLPQQLNNVQAVSAPACVNAVNTLPLPNLKDISTYWHSPNQLVIKPQLTNSGQVMTLTLLNQQGGKILTQQADSIVYNTHASATCFALNYASSCGTTATAPAPFCPIYLQNNTTEPDIFEPVWTPYTGYEAGVASYALQELDNTGSIIAEWNTGQEITYTAFSAFTLEDNGRRFRVVAYPQIVALAPSYSNIFTFELIMKGYFPNAFSPNGDGINDDFRILGKFVESASLRIYNRWGEELFNTTDKDKGWDGTYRNQPQPAGHYAYKAEITTVDGKQAVVSGTVFLIR